MIVKFRLNIANKLNENKAINIFTILLKVLSLGTEA